MFYVHSKWDCIFCRTLWLHWSWDDGMMNWTYKLIDSLLLESFLYIIYIYTHTYTYYPKHHGDNFQHFQYLFFKHVYIKRSLNSQLPTHPHDPGWRFATTPDATRHGGSGRTLAVCLFFFFNFYCIFWWSWWRVIFDLQLQHFLTSTNTLACGTVDWRFFQTVKGEISIRRKFGPGRSLAVWAGKRKDHGIY